MIFVCVFCISLALACNSIITWNNIALDAIRHNATTPPVASRVLAIVNVAIYDTVTSIDQSQTPYKYNLPTPTTTIYIDVATMAAAYNALLLLFPNQADNLTAHYNNSLATIANDSATDAAVQIGSGVANKVFTDRLSDGTQTYVAYPGSSAAGMWRPTPPKYAAAEVPQYATQRPWCVESSDAFRPEEPPGLQDAAYIHDHNQIASVGALNSGTRTADQTAIAQFWYDGVLTDTPPGHWAEEAAAQACDNNFSLAATARLFALVSMALADAATTAWNAKYTYGRWRPITAIQFANTTGNAPLAFDPEWQPLLNTPNWPDYVSDRAIFGGAASQVLARIFGNNVPITVQAPTLNVSRSFPNFAAAAFEQGQSRVYAGAHFNTSVMLGLYCGQLVGNWTVDNCLQPRAATAVTTPPATSLPATAITASTPHSTVTAIVCGVLTGLAVVIFLVISVIIIVKRKQIANWFHELRLVLV
jgi:hypothetical protein